MKDRLQAAVLWFLFALYVGWRLWIVWTGRCPIDSDEGVFGIISIEMLGGRFVPFFHGQDYMGTLPSVLCVPFMAILGKTPLAMRVAAIAAGVAALLTWRRILVLWRAGHVWPWLALLCAVAPFFMAQLTLKFRGTITVWLLGTLWLWQLVEAESDGRPFDRQPFRWFAIGLLGGLCWWSSQLTVFFLLPGLVVFLLLRENRRRLASLASVPNALIVGAYAVSFTLLIARGTLSYKNPLSAALFELKAPVVLQHVVVAGTVLTLALFGRFPRWIPAAGIGAVLGYLPALLRVFGREVLYNTTSPQAPHRWLINLRGLALEASGSFLGFADETHHPIGVPALVIVCVACLYVLAVVATVLTVFRPKSEPASRAEFFFLMALVMSWGLLAMTVHQLQPAPHYALFSLFFLMGTVACFLVRLSRIHVSLPWLAAPLFLGLNAFSTIKAPSEPVRWNSMVPLEEARLIEFLAEQEIEAAATSFRSSSWGYWDAYRLSMSAGESVRIHPILHMPRVDRYRVGLREATKTAIVTRVPEETVEVLDRYGLNYKATEFGGLTVVWGFDKRRADELLLFDYRQSLEEPLELPIESE